MAAISRKQISILGDSISTFEGYSPAFDAFYTHSYAASSGIDTAEATWWMQVIRALEGELLVNSSYMGSSVARFGYQPASAPWRIEKLKQGTRLPDLILIYSGLNDLASYTTPEEFGLHYASMLTHIKEIFPLATVCCGTLCWGFLRNPQMPLFVDPRTLPPVSDYNTQIRQVVSSKGCRLADLAAQGVEYSSIDGVHPDRKGMETLAELWISCLNL